MIKLLFCDVDGVLNDLNFLSTDEVKNMSDRLVELEDFYLFIQVNPENVQFLNKIIQETGAKIVISSSWRQLFNVEEFKVGMKLREFQYPENIIGRTILSKNGKRGFEIQEYLDTYSKLASIKYAILEDEPDLKTGGKTMNGLHLGNVFKTEYWCEPGERKGLTEKIALKVIEHLNN